MLLTRTSITRDSPTHLRSPVEILMKPLLLISALLDMVSTIPILHFSAPSKMHLMESSNGVSVQLPPWIRTLLISAECQVTARVLPVKDPTNGSLLSMVKARQNISSPSIELVLSPRHWLSVWVKHSHLFMSTMLAQTQFRKWCSRHRRTENLTAPMTRQQPSWSWRRTTTPVPTRWSLMSLSSLMEQLLPWSLLISEKHNLFYSYYN